MVIKKALLLECLTGGAFLASLASRHLEESHLHHCVMNQAARAPPTLFGQLRRYSVTAAYPLILGSLIYLDWSRTQRYKAAKAAKAAKKSN